MSEVGRHRRFGDLPPPGRVQPFAALPPFALQFMQLHRPAHRVVRLFHQWLKATYRPLLQLESREVEQFLLELERSAMSARKQAHFRHLALVYFDWLHARSLLRFDPRCAWPRSNFPLPPAAQRFLDTLKPTRKLSTVRSYQTNLRQFHIWLHAERLDIENLRRADLEAWLGWLHARGLHAATRLHAVQNVRAYLLWLDEQGALAAESGADALLRPSDLPKLPRYLPRPVPPDVDIVLQQRLRKSGCRYQRALLLMRWTGLRIGELRDLSFDCIQSDPQRNALLKVPLGKLDTERLVPLDEQTLKLVLKLRRQDRRKRRLLFQTGAGKKTSYDLYRQALRKACNGLAFAEPMTTHRLRHTYATTLLAGGISLPALMRLLGHRDYRMTLRYAAVTDETVASEYADALTRSALRYKTQAPAAAASSASDPGQMLADAGRNLAKRTLDDSLDKLKARTLLKRLRRLEADVRKLLRHQRG